MRDEEKTKEQLIYELAAMRQQLVDLKAVAAEHQQVEQDLVDPIKPVDTQQGRTTELLQELTDARAELDGALAQQTATSDILRVISRSPTDLQPVFDMIAQSAVRLCDGQFCAVHRFDGERLHFVSHYGLTAKALQAMLQTFPMPAGQNSAIGRAILRRDVVHIPDVEADPTLATLSVARVVGYRSLVAVPM